MPTLSETNRKSLRGRYAYPTCADRRDAPFKGSLQASAAARLPSPQTTLAQHRQSALTVYAPLSPREKEVLNLLVQGQAAQKIAQTLGISYATVRNHLQKILHKLGVHSQREAVKLAVEHHLV